MIEVLGKGRVAEWSKAPVSKTGRGFRFLVGSNPTPSAMLLKVNALQAVFRLDLKIIRFLFTVSPPRSAARL